MLKIGFTGTQLGMTDIQKETLKNFLEVNKVLIQEVRHGDCMGADKQFHEICEELSIPIIIHPPIKDCKRVFCKNAINIMPPKDYITRNHDIVDNSDVLLGAPKLAIEELRSGTWATIRYAKKKNIFVNVFFNDGRIKLNF